MNVPTAVFAPTLHTSRLSLTLYSEEDSLFSARCFNDSPESTGQATHQWTEEEVKKLCVSTTLHPSLLGGAKAPGPAAYIVHLGAEPGEKIGLVSLVHRGKAAPPDVGFVILRQYRRKGYCIEAATEALRYWRENLGITQLCAITTEENVASQKVIEKLGFSPAGTLVMDGNAVLAYAQPGMPRFEGQEISFFGEGF